MSSQPEDRRISPVFIVLGVLLVIVLAFAVYVNFLSGDTVEVPPQPTVPPGAAVAPPVPVTPPTPTPPPEDMEIFEIFEGRDPFRPLVFESAVASPPPGTTLPPGTTPPPGGGPTATPRRSGVSVEVLDVASDSSSATVRVGSQVHTDARPGQTLSSGVVIESITGRCVTFVRDGDRFRLCEGESLRK